jgi:hypothetical protein
MGTSHKQNFGSLQFHKDSKQTTGAMNMEVDTEVDNVYTCIWNVKCCYKYWYGVLILGLL